MTLGTKQALFTKRICRLVEYINSDPDTRARFDQVKRTQAEADANAASGAGIANSLHRLGLAADILIDKYDPVKNRWVWQKDSEVYRKYGEWWVKQWATPEAVCCWGGEWGDGNHFSIAHNGVK